MNIWNALLTVCLLQASFAVGHAEDPLTIPVEIAHQMKKGKQLDLVWAAPEFDGTRGLRFGVIANETEADAQAVQEFFPMELRRLQQTDSPYTLQMTLTSLRLKAATGDRPSARLELEGRLIDATGKMVAAFTASAASAAGGTAKDCVRLAVRAIVFAMTKDLFTSAIPKTNAKSPAVIVPAAPASVPAAPPAPVAAPEPLAPAPAVSVPGKPAPAPTAAEPIASLPQPKPVSIQPESTPALIPGAIAAKMQRGKSLAKVWISPDYDRSGGFALGEVRYQVEARNDGVDRYFPEGLAEICRAEAPCTLQVRIVELHIRTQGGEGSMVRLGVEGNLVAKDGSLLAAFRTLESVTGGTDLVETCRNASRKVIRAIGKELK